MAGIITDLKSGLSSWLLTIDPAAFIASALLLAGIYFLREKIARVLVNIVAGFFAKLSVPLIDEIVERLVMPTQVLAVTFGFYILFESVDLLEAGNGVLRRLLSSVAIISVFATWYHLSGAFASILRSDAYSPVAMERDWIQRVTQFAIILLGIAAMLRVWQIDIAGALTGVGVLGAGIAIATRDLISNLIAGMTNMSEKRFETGDLIQVEGQFVGEVKRVDLRSTLIVGLDQIPRHVPNSDLSNSVVLNYTTRRHRRVKLTVSLVLTTTPAQIAMVCERLRLHLEQCGDFDLDPDAPKHVYLNSIGPSSLDILFYARTKSPDYTDYLQAMERLQIAILEAVESAGSELAYPTQTIHLVPDHMPESHEKPASPSSSGVAT